MALDIIITLLIGLFTGSACGVVFERRHLRAVRRESEEVKEINRVLEKRIGDLEVLTDKLNVNVRSTATLASAGKTILLNDNKNIHENVLATVRALQDAYGTVPKVRLIKRLLNEHSIDEINSALDVLSDRKLITTDAGDTLRLN